MPTVRSIRTSHKLGRGTSTLRFVSGAQSIKAADQKGRLGVMYVRSLLAQAGVINSECSPGEDYLATDVTVEFPIGSVRVQIKAGTKKPNRDGSITVPVNDVWKAKWSKTAIPTFLVYVHLGKLKPAEWIDHQSTHTILYARALWMQVNAVTGSSVTLPAQNRLTAETFDGWVDEFEQRWGKAASV